MLTNSQAPCRSWWIVEWVQRGGRGGVGGGEET